LQAERRHHPCQPEERGVLGQAREPARLAVSPGRHQARRNPAAGDVPRVGGGDRAAASPRPDPRPHARLAALRGAREVDAPLQGGGLRLPRTEADLVSAAHDGARLRREAARERPSRVRRVALARLLGAARRRDRIQARGVSPGADRAAPLPAGRPPRPGPASRGRPARVRYFGFFTGPSQVPLRFLMEREFDPLPIRELGAGAGFRRPNQAEAARVTPDSPALHVMTDLARVSPTTIRPQAPLAGANQFMITRGVRLLLVVDERDIILGLITATDLLGERPMQVATERGLRRDELSVGDVMTPAAEIEVVALADVEGSRV